MFDHFETIFTQLLNSITPGQFEGILLYSLGALSSTIVKLHFRKEWSAGMKGANGRWESPEILLTILFIIIDHLFMADAFLNQEMSQLAWIAIGFLFLYGFTGRWGLEWLSSIKGGTTILKTTTEESKKTETTSSKKDDGENDDAGS